MGVYNSSGGSKYSIIGLRDRSGYLLGETGGRRRGSISLGRNFLESFFCF